VTSKPSRPKTAEMTFWEHTAELLSRLRIILASVILAGVAIGFLPTDIASIFNPLSFNYTPLVSIVLKRIQRDLLPPNVVLIAGSVVDTATVYLVMSMLVGVAVCTPVIAYELFMFTNPALYPHERKFMFRFMFSFIVLFVAGAIFSYKVVIPVTLRVLLWFIFSAGAAPFIPIADFVYQVVTLIVVVGLFYTFPVFFVLLVKQGIIPSDYLTTNRKGVYVAFLVAAIVLTADPTPITDMLLFVPFVVLFEMTVWVSKYLEKRAEHKQVT